MDGHANRLYENTRPVSDKGRHGDDGYLRMVDDLSRHGEDSYLKLEDDPSRIYENGSLRPVSDEERVYSRPYSQFVSVRQRYQQILQPSEVSTTTKTATRTTKSGAERQMS